MSQTDCVWHVPASVSQCGGLHGVRVLIGFVCVSQSCRMDALRSTLHEIGWTGSDEEVEATFDHADVTGNW